MPAEAGRPETTGIRFHVSLQPELLASEVDLIVSKDSNPGILAGQLVEHLERRNLVTLSGMGELPISLALKAGACQGLGGGLRPR